MAFDLSTVAVQALSQRIDAFETALKGAQNLNILRRQHDLRYEYSSSLSTAHIQSSSIVRSLKPTISDVRILALPLPPPLSPVLLSKVSV